MTFPVILSLIGNVLICLGLFFIGPLPGVPFHPSVTFIILACAVHSLGYSNVMVSSFGRWDGMCWTWFHLTFVASEPSTPPSDLATRTTSVLTSWYQARNFTMHSSNFTTTKMIQSNQECGPHPSTWVAFWDPRYPDSSLNGMAFGYLRPFSLPWPRWWLWWTRLSCGWASKTEKAAYSVAMNFCRS